MSPSRPRRTLAALTLAALLPLALPGAASARVRSRPSARRPASAASAASAIFAAAPWSSLADLWRRLTAAAAADPAADPGGVRPTDDNGGGVDPNGKPKPAPPHP